MNFLKQANTAFKSAKELEKNLASVGITKNKFMGKKEETNPTGAAGVPVAPYVAAEVPPHIRQEYEARKPEFEAQLAALKELAWSAAIDAAARNAHADQQAAKTASPDYVLDALSRLQDYVKKFENTGGSPPPVINQYGSPPQVNQYGSPPQGNQYGTQPQVNQYGSPPQGGQPGNQPQVNQYGSPPQGGQYGTQPQVHQYGGQPPANQYGTQAPIPQYGNTPPAPHY